MSFLTRNLFGNTLSINHQTCQRYPKHQYAVSWSKVHYTTPLICAVLEFIYTWTLPTAYKDRFQPSERGSTTWVTNEHALQYYIEWSLYAFIEGFPPPVLLANSQWIISTVHGCWNYACWTNDKLVNFRNFGQIKNPLNLVQNRTHYRVWRLNCFLMPLIF